MFTLFKNAEVFLSKSFHKADVLVCENKIADVGDLQFTGVKIPGITINEVDCTDHYLCPGLIDSQLLMAGGSGESGFLSQSPRIHIEECISGGITTVVGTLGVDTITKTMSQLFACIRAFCEAGMSAYAYSGGYEIPCRTLTSSLREDILYVNEIIGAGEVAIADRRAPEPDPATLAKVVIESYVAGFLSKKAGITRVHVGEGKKRLQTLFDMFEQHEIIPACLYLTHLQRNRDLVVEGIKAANLGCFIDFDIQENDLEVWYRIYKDLNGPLDKLSFSSDAGVSSPKELWSEIRKCCLKFNFKFEELLFHVTEVPAFALHLTCKGRIAPGFDADLFVVKKNHLEIRDVMAGGKFFMINNKFLYEDQLYTIRRGMDCYGLRD